MSQDDNPVPVDESGPEQDEQPHWFQRIAAVVYVFFCFELGVFLLLFPWFDLWENNYLASLHPGWYEVWRNPYLRGAVSGVGLINLAISFSELFRLRRFARRKR
jgi:hypothetical protein